MYNGNTYRGLLMSTRTRASSLREQVNQVLAQLNEILPDENRLETLSKEKRKDYLKLEQLYENLFYEWQRRLNYLGVDSVKTVCTIYEDGRGTW